MKESKPDLYYYSSLAHVPLAAIEGTAIVLIGSDIEMTAYFVKEGQFVTGVDAPYKTYPVDKTLKASEFTEGKISTVNRSLERILLNIEKKAAFPYALVEIILSKDGVSIELYYPNENQDALGVVLQEYNSRERSASDTLAFLRQIKGIPYAEQSVSCKARTNGFSWVDGISFPMSGGLNGMIEHFLQVMDSFYKAIFKKIDSISSRFQNSSLTSQKKEILADFRDYCATHAEATLSRFELVKDWSVGYKEKTGQNPFDILSKQRRNVPSLFNPAKTDSIKLFETFIGKEHHLEEVQSSLHSTQEKGSDYE